MAHVPTISVKERERADGVTVLFLDFRCQGRRYRKTVAVADQRGRAVADQEAAGLRVAIAEGRFDPKAWRAPGGEDDRPFRELAADFLTLCATGLKSKRRLENCVDNLNRVFGNLRLPDVTPRSCQAYQARRRDEVAPRTVNMELGVLRRIFSKGVEWGVVQENPALNIRPLREARKSDRYLSGPSYQGLLAECPMWLRPVVALAATTGLRQGELLRLHWSDVDRTARLIHVRETKTGEPRTVPIFRDAAAVLDAVPPRVDAPSVFAREDGSPLLGDSVTRAFKRTARRAGLPEWCFHDLRHHFASTATKRGVTQRALMAILGHKTPAMTARYSHLAPGYLDDARRAMDTCVDTYADTPRASEGQGAASGDEGSLG